MIRDQIMKIMLQEIYLICTMLRSIHPIHFFRVLQLNPDPIVQLTLSRIFFLFLLKSDRSQKDRVCLFLVIGIIERSLTTSLHILLLANDRVITCRQNLVVCILSLCCCHFGPLACKLLCIFIASPSTLGIYVHTYKLSSS